jgi:hypothetical protein
MRARAMWRLLVVSRLTSNEKLELELLHVSLGRISQLFGVGEQVHPTQVGVYAIQMSDPEYHFRLPVVSI